MVSIKETENEIKLKKLLKKRTSLYEKMLKI